MDLENKAVIFEFELDPLLPLSLSNTSLAFDLRLTWSQVGSIQARNGGIQNNQVAMPLERVGQNGTYRLSVPLIHIWKGRLLVKLTINIFCSGYLYTRYNGKSCNQWHIRANSDPLEITDKRG